MLRRVARRAGVSRGSVASLRMCCERNTLARIRRRADGQRSRILCYHSVGTPAWGVNDVSPANFARQIECALGAGRRFVDAGTIARGQGAPGDLAITFDDGLASVQNALPVLQAYTIPFTLFIVSRWADGSDPSFAPGTFLGWRDIEHLCERGATIGSHSVTHPNFGQLSPGQAREELFNSRDTIEQRLGIRPASFAIPFGQSRDWTAESAATATAAGYSVVYAQSESRRPAGTIPRTFITRWDSPRVFAAALGGAFDTWEEWV